MGQAASGCCVACCDTGKDNLLGLAVKNVLRSFDKGLLGVDLHVGGLRFVPHSWRVELEDIVMENPEGYRSEYLLKASRLYLDLDGAFLLSSLGKKASVDELVFEGVDLIYEPKLGTSNLTEVKRKLKQLKEAEEQDKEAKAKAKNKNKISVIMHRVALQGVHARMLVGGFGPVLRVADIIYEDFSQQFKGATAVMDVIRILLSTVLRSALHTVGHNVKGAGEAAISGAKSTMSFATTGAKAVMSKVSNAVANSKLALKCVRPEQEEEEIAGGRPK